MTGPSEPTDRRSFLRAAGVALAGGLSGLLGIGADTARAEETHIESEPRPEPEATRDSTEAASHWFHVPLGTDVLHNRMNNWSPEVNQSGAGPHPFSSWQRNSVVLDALQSPMEGVYREAIEEPRKSMTTRSVSIGGAGTVDTTAWAGMEFYTSGTAGRTTTIATGAKYDAGENWLDLSEITGAGYAGNFLEMSVVDLTGGNQLARETTWYHAGTPGETVHHNQSEGLVWATGAVNVNLYPNRYYGVYFLQRSIATSLSPITGAWHPPKASATQHVGIGLIHFGF